MAGSRSLSYLQIGKETTKGTPVAATRILSSDISGSFNVDWGYTFHEGRSVASHNPISYGTRQYERVSINFRTPDDTGISFDELPFFITQPAGGTAGSGSTAFTWSGAWGGTADGSAVSYTLEFGDDIQAFEAEYGMVSRIAMSGGADNMTTLEADMHGRQSTKTTKTALSATDDVRIPAYLWVPKFASAGSALSTAATFTTLREWEAEWTTGLMPHWYADGNDYFGKIEESGAVTGSVRLVVDSNATAVSQFYDKGEAGTKDFLRLQAVGESLGGTAYTAVLEFGLFYENVTPLGGEVDGLNTYEVEARIVYDATWGKAIGATAICSLETLSS
jgi:hypothetical protein